MEPLVSICCITYNHAPYIKQCIEGFLMQKTTFSIEILIHDDCSTDGTTEIIRDYEKKYPDLIFPLYEEENQYQKGKASEIDFYNYKRARGKYIAYCEGDDYWTDPLKLQKQVDFMEANPDYSVCFHDFKKYIVDKNIYLPSNINFFIKKNNIIEGVTLGISDVFSEWLTMPLTMVFRKANLDLSISSKYKYYRDTHEIYHLMKRGKCYLFAFTGGVSHRHNGGVYASLNKQECINIQLAISAELYNVNKDRYTKEYYIISLQEYLYSKPKSFKDKCVKAIALFQLTYNLKKLIKNIFR